MIGMDRLILSTGVYYVYINSNGCDSLATLNLTINPSTTSTLHITSCDSYDWNGLTYTIKSEYTCSTFLILNGCDSLATLNLTINPSTHLQLLHSCDSY